MCSTVIYIIGVWHRYTTLANIVLCLVFGTDPRQWSELDVSHWLNWAVREFSLEGVNQTNFTMRGKDMCALGKESFLARTPPFMGDILWEHLDILQKGFD